VLHEKSVPNRRDRTIELRRIEVELSDIDVELVTARAAARRAKKEERTSREKAPHRRFVARGGAIRRPIAIAPMRRSASRSTRDPLPRSPRPRMRRIDELQALCISLRGLRRRRWARVSSSR
jgi:hypothetical protein